MGIEITDRGLVGIAVRGDVDTVTAPLLAKRIAELGASPWVDLSECTFMDSNGLAVLVDAHKAAHVAGGQLSIVAPSDCVSRLLTICGLVEVLNIRTSSVGDS